jgi:hypothetical protein
LDLSSNRCPAGFLLTRLHQSFQEPHFYLAIFLIIILEAECFSLRSLLRVPCTEISATILTLRILPPNYIDIYFSFLSIVILPFGVHLFGVTDCFCFVQVWIENSLTVLLGQLLKAMISPDLAAAISWASAFCFHGGFPCFPVPNGFSSSWPSSDIAKQTVGRFCA